MSNAHIKNKNGARFAELDGLRALAVVSVILFHCEISGLFNAGFFGVDMFFTISGFIITAILLKEYRQTADFNFLHFYFRRLKRLLPPVLGLIGVALVLTPSISPGADTWLKADVPAALIYFSNWWQIATKQSYFDTTPHLLRHLWSLAVEEQFYVLWPPIAYALLKKFGPKTTGWISFMLALLSTAWMSYLYALNIDGADQNRIYLGTDTHAMGLLTGAALAGCWNPWAPKIAVSAQARHGWRAAASLSLAALGVMLWTMNFSHPALYQGSFLLVPILTCVVAYCTMNDSAFFLSCSLRSPIVQWAGLRSYSLYLVHWPIFVGMRLLNFNDFSHWQVLAGGLVVVGLLSELMYRCIEAPSIRFDRPQAGARPMSLVLSSYAIAATACFFLAAVVAPGDKNATLLAAGPAADAGNGGSDQRAETGERDVAVPASPDKAIDADETISGGEDIYAIGDSVLLGARAHLLKAIPGIRVDAAVGRQASQGLKLVKEWRDKSHRASTVLLHLGTNGYINENQYKELLRELADRPSVIVMNVHAQRRWTAPNNEIIERMTREFPNVHLINWNLASSQRPDYFVKDGIHLTWKGILALTAEIKLGTGGSVIMPETASSALLADAQQRHGLAHKTATVERDERATPDVKVLALAEEAAEPTNAAPTGRGAEGKTSEAQAEPLPAGSAGPVLPK